MDESRSFTHCPRRHLVVLRGFGQFLYWGHVHENEALECAAEPMIVCTP